MNKQIQEPHNLAEALDSIKSGKLVHNKPIKFTEMVDVAVNLVVPKDTTVRGYVKAPEGLSRQCVIAVFADKECEGADYMVTESEVQAFFTNKLYKKCDVCIAEKRYLPILAKVGAKKLGPRKLMPDLRFGTVTENPAEALRVFKHGVISFRGAKSTSKAQKKSVKTEHLIVHVPIGKVSQDTKALKTNFAAFVGSLKEALPARGKIHSIYLSTTMGKAIKLSLDEVTL